MRAYNGEKAIPSSFLGTFKGYLSLPHEKRAKKGTPMGANIPMKVEESKMTFYDWWRKPLIVTYSEEALFGDIGECV